MDYSKLIRKLAIDLYKPTQLYSLEDLFQIGMLSVIKDSKHFNPDKNTKKSSFVALCARRDMIRFIKKHRGAFKNKPLIDSEYREFLSLKEELPSMGGEDYAIAEMLYNGYSRREIAKRFKYTKSELERRLMEIGRIIQNAKKESTVSL